MAQFYSPARRSKQQDILILTADSLDALGQGVARHQGKTVFIPFLLPTESAQVTLIQDKRQFAKAKIIKRLSSSKERQVAQCVHFGLCGGCQQQHVSSELQHKSKKAFLAHLFKRETGTILEDIEVISGDNYGYRRRARLGLQYQPKTHQLTMGFRQLHTNNLIALKMCPILCSELASLLKPLQNCLEQLSIVNRLGHIELVLADNGVIAVLRHLAPLSAKDRQIILAFSALHNIAFYTQAHAKSSNNEQQNPVNSDGFSEKGSKKDSEQLLECLRAHKEQPYYCVDNLKLHFNPQDFIQVNATINHQMIQQAISWLDLSFDDRVLDLFCGMGNFTLPIAKRAGFTVGIEGVPTLVESAKANAIANGLINVSFYHENLAQDISKQPWASLGFNKVLLDPARAGAAFVMPHIIKLAPECVVYVSCDPSTLVRDSQKLLEAGYEIKYVRMLDMFPHTGHLESMVLFHKISLTSK